MLKALVKIAILLFVPATAFAVPDLQDIMVNLQKIINPFMQLLLVISFIGGLIFMLKGLMMLKAFAQPLTQATRPGEMAGPIVYLLVGTVLIYIPTSTDFLSHTIFGSNGLNSIFSNSTGKGSFTVDVGRMGSASQQIMGYAGVGVESQWALLLDTVVLYMEFIGFIAFLRGWFIIAHAGHGAQPGTIGKGIIHIIGGILAINFLPLVDAVKRTVIGS